MMQSLYNDYFPNDFDDDLCCLCVSDCLDSYYANRIAIMDAVSVTTSTESSLFPLLPLKFAPYYEQEPLISNVPYIEYQNIRITPGQIIFDNAIDGRTFFGKIRIQNLGNSTAFIRILPATSYAFHIESIPRGVKLSPGLSLERYVKYQSFRLCTVASATLPIFINDECVDYKMFIFVENQSMWDETSARYVDENVSLTSGMVSLEEAVLSETSSKAPHTYYMNHDNNSVRVILYGKAEFPEVMIRPDALDLHNLEIDKTVTREILLTNKSSSLPIIFTFKKTFHINIEPSSGTLCPNGKIELCVLIKPTSFGEFNSKIQFDLLLYNQPTDNKTIKIGEVCVTVHYQVPSTTKFPMPKFNMGITPKCLKEVGMFTDNVRFNSNIPMPKTTLMRSVHRRIQCDDGDLIAFPNDRPQTIRPWRSNAKYRTICAHIYRTMGLKPDKFEITENELNLRKKTYEHYKKLLSERAKQRDAVIENLDLCHDEDFTTFKKFLTKIAKKPKCTNAEETLDKCKGYVPLMPSQLQKIRVYPSEIDLGKVAPRTSKLKSITVENNSISPIILLMTSKRRSISFPNDNVITVPSMAKKEVTLSYQSPHIVGRYATTIDCIINFCDSFSISVSVDVIPKSIKLACQNILLDDEIYTFINLHNPVNDDTTFLWNLPNCCFQIEPLSGILPSYSNLTCFIKYIPAMNLPLNIDATLYSDNRIRQIVNIAKIEKEPIVKLQNSIVEFKSVPINTIIRKIVMLENFENEPIHFVIDNPEPIHGVSVQPKQGVIPSYGEYVLLIRIEIPVCLTFQCTVTIQIQNYKAIGLTLLGEVVFPNIAFQPNAIKLKKIVPYSFERRVFIVYNKSPTPVTIDFDLKDYTEYSISESRTKYDATSLKRLELQPNSEKELYLHFQPTGPAVYSFYLPVVINELFGPVDYNNYKSEESNFYVQSASEKYESYPNVQLTELPEKLPCLFISTNVGCNIITFSKLNFNFKCYNRYRPESETESELVISNSSQDTCKFCIRTDNLNQPFSLQYVSGDFIEFLQYAVVCTLEPKSEVTFFVSFCPILQGTYYVQLPIYLRHCLDGGLFNYLTLTGCNQSPTFTSITDVLYFEPVPTTCETEKKFTINLEFHNEECVVHVEKDNEIKLRFMEKIVKRGTGYMTIIVKFVSKVSMTIDYSVLFTCSCGAQYRLHIKGCVENCVLTNHAFASTYIKQPLKGKKENIESADDSVSMSAVSVQEILVNVNETSFPFYPENDDTSKYADHMKEIVVALEEWICHQGFYGKKFYVIPNTIAVAPEPQTSESTKNSSPILLKYIELLRNLVGPIISNYITITDIPIEDVDRVNYMYSCYKQVICFVTGQGGFLSHVAPQNLLRNYDYNIFIKYVFPNKTEFAGKRPPEILSKEKYFFLCKQSWIDLLLQTYKVFVLQRVKVPKQFEKTKNGTTTEIYSRDEMQFWDSFDSQSNVIWYNRSELILIHWLEYHFKRQVKVWGENPQTRNLVNEKRITNFDFDLNDGIVLIAVTLQYCSYLKSYFSDVYLQPTNTDQTFHNASKLIQSWNVINLSFKITPFQILNANCVQMLILVNYLFQVLPTFCANNVVTIQAGIGTVATKEFEVQNQSSSVISYKVILLGNKRERFSVPNRTIYLSPSHKYKLIVSFYAKFLDDERGTLILSGECSGTPYARSMAFRLVGKAILSHATTTISLPLPIYQVHVMELAVTAPYEGEAEYNINYALSEPNSSNQSSIVNCNTATLQSKIPKRVNFPTNQILFDMYGKGTLNVIICALTTNEKPTWIIFTHPTIGCFTILLITIPTYSKELYVPIEAKVSAFFNKSKCLCKNSNSYLTNGDCPRRIVISLPCKNVFLWNACAELVLKTSEQEDLGFWTKYINTAAGVQIMKWITELESNNDDYFDIQQTFQTTVKYFVCVEPDLNDITTVPTTIISNVHVDDTHQICIHVATDLRTAIIKFFFAKRKSSNTCTQHTPK
ncbi:hypothetical protein FQA39_LY08913 [Lamprigera yunnana]|nr:hypothetical protein FQA39_LY08913 [Lamprigera yunnana]